MKKAFLGVLSVSILFMCVATVVFSSGTEESEGWNPKRTINLIVPWGAGGATDQTARVLASEMEPVLGTKIAVVNQPGASGSIGTKTAFEAEHDGYTWTANGHSSVATFQVRGLTPNISYKDWQGYFAISSPCVICVNPDSPIKDWDSLVEAFNTREVLVATAGIGAGGHTAIEIFCREMGVKYKHAPYKGGNPAIVSTVAGETEVVMQLSMEVADMLRAKKLRSIAVLSDQPLTISGAGEIPPVTDFVKDFPPVAFYFGLYVAKDIPEDARKAIAKAFDVASKSEAIEKLAQEKGSMAVSIQGEAADQLLAKSASQFGWLFYDLGIVDTSPEKFGIPRL